MLKVEHSGYSFERGWYRDEYSIDPDKTDYEIRFPDGDVYRQKSEFHNRTADWNHDGDVYEQFGAYFEIKSLGRREFLTPVDMVNFIKEERCTVPGVTMATVFGKKAPLYDNISDRKDTIQSEKQNACRTEKGYER